MQDAVLKSCGNILQLHLFAHIKGSGQAAGITLAADVFAGFLIRLVFIKPLGGADIQVTVFKGNGNLVLLKAGQINVNLVRVVILHHIGFN